MTQPSLLVPDHVLQDWLAALDAREPRALELAYALALTLPEAEETGSLKQRTHVVDDSNEFEISPEVRDLLNAAAAKYDALAKGIFQRVDMGNPNVLAFERQTGDERLLVVHNLARVAQPIKFHAYAGREGWDILNRVEFLFPPRAQLEAYEFLWLLVE